MNQTAILIMYHQLNSHRFKNLFLVPCSGTGSPTSLKSSRRGSTHPGSLYLTLLTPIPAGLVKRQVDSHVLCALAPAFPSPSHILLPQPRPPASLRGGARREPGKAGVRGASGLQALTRHPSAGVLVPPVPRTDVME